MIMSTPQPLEIDELQNVLRTLERCLDCREPPCMRACPEQIDLRGAFKALAGQSELARSLQESLRAEDFARDGIEESFA